MENFIVFGGLLLFIASRGRVFATLRRMTKLFCSPEEEEEAGESEGLLTDKTKEAEQPAEQPAEEPAEEQPPAEEPASAVPDVPREFDDPPPIDSRLPELDEPGEEEEEIGSESESNTETRGALGLFTSSMPTFAEMLGLLTARSEAAKEAAAAETVAEPVPKKREQEEEQDKQAEHASGEPAERATNISPFLFI